MSSFQKSEKWRLRRVDSTSSSKGRVSEQWHRTTKPFLATTLSSVRVWKIKNKYLLWFVTFALNTSLIYWLLLRVRIGRWAFATLTCLKCSSSATATPRLTLSFWIHPSLTKSSATRCTSTVSDRRTSSSSRLSLPSSSLSLQETSTLATTASISSTRAETQIKQTACLKKSSILNIKHWIIWEIRNTFWRRRS